MEIRESQIGTKLAKKKAKTKQEKKKNLDLNCITQNIETPKISKSDGSDISNGQDEQEQSNKTRWNCKRC